MAQPKPYRFTLIGRIEFINDGEKTVTTEELVLDHLPGGWKDYSVKWGMHRNYFGYGRTLAFNLRFFKKAANMLRMYYDNFGIDADVTLRVEKGNMGTYQYDFEADFNIDFKGYNSYQHYVDVDISEKGISQMLESRDNNTYDIPMNEGQMVSVRQGINLQEVAVYDRVYSELTKIKSTGGYNTEFDMKFNVEGSSIETINYVFQSSNSENVPFLIISGVAAQQNPETVNMKLTHNFNLLFDIQNNGTGTWPFYDDSFKLKVYVKQTFDDNTSVEHKILDKEMTFSYWANTGIPFSRPVPIILDKDIIPIVHKNSKITMYCEMSTGWQSIGYRYYLRKAEFTGVGSFEYYGSIQTGAFSFRAYQVKDWFQKIFERMRETDTQYEFTDKLAYLAQNCNDRIMVTSADAIRGIEGAVGKGGFRDLFNSLSGVLGCGAAIEENQIYLLQKELIFNPGVCIADIGGVSRIKVYPFVEWIKNRFKFGYPNKDYDKLNGRHEFNTTVEFISPVKNADENEQSFVSKYRADSFGIHWLRREYSKKDSKDSHSDNDMFFVAVRKDTDGNIFVEQDIPENSIITGIGQKGLFNFLLSPKRNMIRNGNLLSAYCDKTPTQKFITFANSEKVDSKLISQILPEESSVWETEDVQISDLQEPLFKPMIFEFDSAAQFSLPNTMKRPHGYIRFNYHGLELKGFVYEVVEASTPKKAQEFRLIAHPDTPNNVSRLIADAGK